MNFQTDLYRSFFMPIFTTLYFSSTTYLYRLGLNDYFVRFTVSNLNTLYV